MTRSIGLPKDRRLAIVGHTGTGKSLLAHALFVASEGRRRIVIDPYDDPDTTVGPWGRRTPKDKLWPTTSSPRVDWSRSDTWRVVPADPGDLDWYHELYDTSIFRVGDMLVWNDEMDDGTNSHEIPIGIRRVLRQGRKRDISHIACSAQAVGVHPTVWRQAEYWAVFHQQTYDDRTRVAKSTGLHPAQFEIVEETLGKHGFMWWDSIERRRMIFKDGLRLGSSPAA